MWGLEHWGVVPDVLCVAKSLGGGVMPIGAFMGNRNIWKAFEEPNPFMHTTTTGGNPLACAAAIAAINVTIRDNLPARAEETGKYFMDNLRTMADKYPQIYKGISGKGLLIGQHFQAPEYGYNVAAGLFKRRVLVAGTLISSNTVRFEPPLLIDREQIDEVLNRLEDTLKETASSI